jgi:transcriptional regulator with XRE-family HTH domain
MARVTLTKKKAQELFRAREATGKSQYEVAEELGWVRSKIKRLEKAEVKTILEEDLQTLEEYLGVQESSSKEGAPVKKRSSRKVISMFKAEDLFSNVLHLPERTTGKNLQFFEVTMAKTMSAEDLHRVREIELLGVMGSINGVENSQSQVPIPAGDRVVIMLWGAGIGKETRNLNAVAKRARRAQG